MLMVYSTTGVLALDTFGDSAVFVRKQALAVFLGFLALIMMTFVPVSWFKKVSPILFPVGLLLLILTLLPGLGESSGGAQRWLRLGPLRFQPSELVKLSFVLFLAGYLDRHEARLDSFLHGIVKPFGFVGVVAALLLLQPDFGSSAIISLVTLTMCAASGTRIRHLILCALGLGVAASALILTSPYRMKRVLSFLSPMEDPAGKGYQLIQSLIAVGSGEVSGMGLGQSQQKLFFLPAAHTDFVFAVVGEELGFIGCLTVIALFVALLWRGLHAARQMGSDTFCFALAVGLTMLLVIPAFLNMGVVLGVLPTKGLVLPLVGYGGSSMISSLVTVGMLLALIRGRDTVDSRL